MAEESRLHQLCRRLGPSFACRDCREASWDDPLTEAQLLAIAQERFPVGCRVRYNEDALSSFRKKDGQRHGVVAGHDAYFAKELGKPNICLKIWWGNERFATHAHPCWIEKQ